MESHCAGCGCRSRLPLEFANGLWRKLNAYLTAGCTVLVVEPEREEVEVHRPGQKVTVLSIDDTLTLDELPGFQLPVKVVFGK